MSIGGSQVAVRAEEDVGRTGGCIGKQQTQMGCTDGWVRRDI